MIYDLRFTICKRRARSGAANRQSAIGNHQSERGVALIITLIMLAVITFMATTFLVLSRRERGAVTTNTDQTHARFAADSALERAKVELLARILDSENDQDFDLMVPTNFYNPAGFNAALGVYNPTNVNYEHLFNAATPLNDGQLKQNIANLLYNPRPPVFVLTNRTTGQRQFRYWLDLNRNGRFDPSGAVSNIVNAGGTLVTNGVIDVIGDPQWIGVLRFPDRPHSADNPFVARWTYVVQPAGKTLDVNYLHNQANNQALDPFGANYRRNEGVGSWEINLAAFLHDLNTNIAAWGGLYAYDPLVLPAIVSGNAFTDASALLAWRYNFNYNNLGFGFPGLALNGLDNYSDGLFMIGTTLPGGSDPAPAATRWLGSYNPNHYFTMQELFDPGKTSAFFVNRLMNAGVEKDTYNVYTFYRLLAQLGTDSAPDRRINLNYRNVNTNGQVVPGMETNMIAWDCTNFFRAAAKAMFQKLDLKDHNNRLITTTNIPVWPTNFYTPAVHRVLQMAANMFEVTTNGFYPCIYRPLFTRAGTNIYISGYEVVNGPDNLPTAPAFYDPSFPTGLPRDLNIQADRNLVGAVPTSLNFYGVPWVIGARKGFPNLNQIAIQSVSEITRKLEIYRPLTKNGWTDYSAKQMFIIGVSNTIAVEFWNSYRTRYTNTLSFRVDGHMVAAIANDLGFTYGPIKLPQPDGFAGIWVTNQLQGSGLLSTTLGRLNTFSFVVPLVTNLVVIPNSYCVGGTLYPVALNNGNLFWGSIPANDLRQPGWDLRLTNNIRCMIFDGAVSGGRVVDYAQLNKMEAVRDLDGEILDKANGLGVWSTNRSSAYWGGMPEGIVRQIGISMNSPTTSETDWSNQGLDPDTKTRQTSYFTDFMTQTTVESNKLQVPFSPTAKIRQLRKWEANDPLVHYMTDDLVPLSAGGGGGDAISAFAEYEYVRPPNGIMPSVTNNFWALNDRYKPWARLQKPSPVNAAIQDPLVGTSDDWNFPTNKLPNIGWLGRVHRGTPWQTVYMKSSDVTDNNTALGTWMAWTGDGTIWPGSTNFGARYSSPVNDRWLFDIFTATPNENAGRGQLSVNQTNLAAWSAILSGVIALTNDPNIGPVPWVISPAGVFDWGNPPPLARIWTNINNTRTNRSVFRDGTFNYAGDVLAAPLLTEASPFLNTADVLSGDPDTAIPAGGITDEVLERIPQQIMGLLNMNPSPRFVVYAYGQTLRPAEASIVTGLGGFSGLCTNYQVTAETAVRAVVRVDGSPDTRFDDEDDQFGRRYPPRIVVEQYNVLPPD